MGQRLVNSGQLNFTKHRCPGALFKMFSVPPEHNCPVFYFLISEKGDPLLFQVFCSYFFLSMVKRIFLIRSICQVPGSFTPLRRNASSALHTGSTHTAKAFAAFVTAPGQFIRDIQLQAGFTTSATVWLTKGASTFSWPPLP